mgnify:CR=1 FL=1
MLILVKGADLLVKAASKLAKRLSVPSFVIGLFIIALGTSAPEMAIGIFSGLDATNLLTLGDVIGSNIINILVVIGITAIIMPLSAKSFSPRREIILSFITQLVLLFMFLNDNILSRVEAGILLVGMLVFAIYSFVKAKKGEDSSRYNIGENDEIYGYVEKQDDTFIGDEIQSESVIKLVGILMLGLVMLILGANVGVDNAVKIAHDFSLSEEFIGLTIIAVGTSLPEIVTSIIAVFRKEEDIAVGNIVGSNIINILFVLGISALINPIVAGEYIYFDIMVMLLATIFLFVPSFFYGKVSRRSGLVFVASYFIYLIYKLVSLGR